MGYSWGERVVGCGVAVGAICAAGEAGEGAGEAVFDLLLVHAFVVYALGVVTGDGVEEEGCGEHEPGCDGGVHVWQMRRG